jgi:carotene epsilon-monooxygenase
LVTRASSEDRDRTSGKDTAGAGATFISPGWLTALQRNWGDASAAGVPRADAKPDDVADLLGGALFLALYKWFRESGPVYLLPTGPVSSFLVISDPQAAKHVLRGYPAYGKGLVREVSEFLFGSGFAISEGELWKGRRRAVVPSLHKAYLEAMVRRVFTPCTDRLVAKLQAAAQQGVAVDVEACFSQLTLDIIGLSVFNYDYDALSKDSPVIQAVYTALKETEQRATDLLPIWKVPLFCLLSPRQRKAAEAVRVIRETTEQLISQCKAIVEAEQEYASLDTEYINERDPCVLRFLLASRVEVTEAQLRDDLLSMLVAGHETTASVLTWTLKLLVDNPGALAKAQAEADRVVGGVWGQVGITEAMAMPYCMRCINESMRLYPHPPVLIRRASEADTLPGGCVAARALRGVPAR